MMLPCVIVSTGGNRWLVRIEDIQEIVPLMALTQVDGIQGNCRGLANLRGEIVSIFDTGDPEVVFSPSRFILISRVNHGPVGLIVDEIHDVITVSQEDISLRPIGGGKSISVACLNTEIIKFLDPREFVLLSQEVVDGRLGNSF